MLKFLAPIFLIIFFPSTSKAQNKINLSIGFGLPEFAHVSIHYQLDQFEIGGGYGTMPIPGDYSNTFFLEGLYHFGGRTEFSEQKPWFVKLGGIYYLYETDMVKHQYSYLNARIGRNFNITNKFGLAIDAGASFQLTHYKVYKTPPTGYNLNIEFPVLPSAALRLYFRI